MFKGLSERGAKVEAKLINESLAWHIRRFYKNGIKP
jgi:hypothetical protein